MNQYSISIIMPAYNAEKYLRKAIESILKQTFRDFEFIIINDGSTDDTEDIILSYIKDSRIKYIRNEQNLKLIKTLNKGIDIASGKYIARMDADDIALPTMLEECYNFFESHPEYSIVAPSVYDMNNEGTAYKIGEECYSSDILPYILLFENVITHPGIMLRADVLKKYKYEDSGLVEHFEDHDCWNRILADHHKIYVLPQRLLLYRINKNGINSLHSIDRSSAFRKRQIYWIKKYTLVDFDVSVIDKFKRKATWNNILLLDNSLNLLYPTIKKKKSRKEFVKWKTLYMVRRIQHSLLQYFVFALYCVSHSKISSKEILLMFLKKKHVYKLEAKYE